MPNIIVTEADFAKLSETTQKELLDMLKASFSKVNFGQLDSSIGGVEGSRLKDFWDVDWHYNIEEAHRLCDTLEVDFDIEVMQKVADEMVLTPSLIAAVVYMTNDMSHRKVANLFNLSATNVLNKKKKLEEII